MQINRVTIVKRCVRMRCPNCARAPLLRSWFHLHAECPECGMPNGREEGFTLGTTSIGYVLALFVVLLPTILLAIQEKLSFWVAIIAGGAGSFLLPIILYPVLLCWVVAFYYGSFPYELPENRIAGDRERP